MTRTLLLLIFAIASCAAAQVRQVRDEVSIAAESTVPILRIELAPDCGVRPTAELMLVDPQERMTGLDNNGRTGRDKPLLQIPASNYIEVREVRMDKARRFIRMITVERPDEGTYWLGVYGTSEGVYRLTVSVTNVNDTTLDAHYRIRLNGGSVHTYLVHYSRGRVSIDSDREPVAEFREPTDGRCSTADAPPDPK